MVIPISNWKIENENIIRFDIAKAVLLGWILFREKNKVFYVEYENNFYQFLNTKDINKKNGLFYTLTLEKVDKIQKCSRILKKVENGLEYNKTKKKESKECTK